jgi:type IV pilus assembly protein PilA
MKVKRGTKGFTLIELLIVVAIIGILAAIAIPAYSGYTAKAKIAGVIHAMGAVKTAVAAYYTEAGTGSVPVAATAADITAIFGVQPPVQYATFDVATTGAITASIVSVSGDTNGTQIVLTPNWGTMTWSWGPGATPIPAAYIPKS